LRKNNSQNSLFLPKKSLFTFSFGVFFQQKKITCFLFFFTDPLVTLGAFFLVEA